MGVVKKEGKRKGLEGIKVEIGFGIRFHTGNDLGFTW